MIDGRLETLIPNAKCYCLVLVRESDTSDELVAVFRTAKEVDEILII
jgi:hypothetical protein